MSGFILAIDQGTTGSTAVVLSDKAKVLGRHNQEFEQHFPKPGWVEHDVEQIWESICVSIKGALAAAKVDGKACLGIGITNQRETTVVWRRSTGKAIHRAIVWQDRRTAERCKSMREEGLLDVFQTRTGLVLDPYFSGTKLEWILDNVAGARALADKGDLAFGTIDSWLTSRLSAGDGGTGAHVTDASNASRTLLYDIHKGAWDEELCGHLNIPKSVLPEVCDSSQTYGRTKGLSVLPDGIPIAGIAGDQQAALFGQTCFSTGDAKCTYGTGAFLLMNTGDAPVASNEGLLTTVAWQLSGKRIYALEGSAFIAGAAVQWLRDGLKVIDSADDIEGLAMQVDSAGEVVFVPALAGLGAPHWDPNARGMICGVSRDTSVAHLCRATLNGIACQIRDLITAMTRDSKKPLSRLRVDGGASRNNLLMQLQADLNDAPVDRPLMVETTALGAGYLAGLAVGVFDGLDEVVSAHQIDKTFDPCLDSTARDEILSHWNAAIRRVRLS